MDFNTKEQAELLHEAQAYLTGIVYCNSQIEFGFDCNYHEELKDARIHQYKKSLRKALEKLEGNAVVIGDLPTKHY